MSKHGSDFFQNSYDLVAPSIDFTTDFDVKWNTFKLITENDLGITSFTVVPIPLTTPNAVNSYVAPINFNVPGVQSGPVTIAADRLTFNKKGVYLIYIRGETNAVASIMFGKLNGGSNSFSSGNTSGTIVGKEIVTELYQSWEIFNDGDFLTFDLYANTSPLGDVEWPQGFGSVVRVK